MIVPLCDMLEPLPQARTVHAELSSDVIEAIPAHITATP
jgi:hypothetical protein